VRRPALLLAILVSSVVTTSPSRAQSAATPSTPDSTESSDFFSSEDGRFDVSTFLDGKFGFLPIVFPITEPAVGYGAGGALAFVDKPIGGAQAGFGRPNVTLVGGLGTANGTRGGMAGDMRHWFGDRLQTLVGIVGASVNLDFHGIGDDAVLRDHPLRYNLEPAGGMLQGRYRVGKSRTWAGLRYTYATTQVTFDAPPSTPGLPDYRTTSSIGSLTPLVSFDSRDNIFTPVSGTYVEASDGIFAEVLGSDDDFQTPGLCAIQYIPLGPTLYLGLKGDALAALGAAPFYMLPYVAMRGVPIMRYQGKQVASGEAEMRWQCWNRFSLVGFGGIGATWSDLEHLDGTRTVGAGGVGFRYELARRYGIHAGMDVAFGPDVTAIYFQTGSAWARP
jgi:hypothetical protein